jgi:hypothetical protein
MAMTNGDSKLQRNSKVPNRNDHPSISPATAVQRALAVFDSLGLIRPTADLLFKKLMTNSPDALLDLLNRIIKPKRPFVELEFLNTEVAPDADGEKAIRLDILVSSDDGTVVDIEIQSGGAAELEQRSVFYVSRLVSESVLAGRRYDSLPVCVVIFIIEGEYFREKRSAHCAFEYCQTEGNEADEGLTRLHPAAPKLHFVLPQSVNDWEKVAGEFPMFSELKKKVERYSADDKLAMQQRAIDEARVAHSLEMGGALRKGREEGREEGRAEGLAEGIQRGIERERSANARAMHAKGLDKEFICSVLKITAEELEQMLV